MTDFKVGDEVVGVRHHEGEKGTVVTAPPHSGGSYIYVKMSDGSTGLFKPSELKLVKPEPKFKVGDWVKVHGRGDKWDGSVCVITGLSFLGGLEYSQLYEVEVKQGYRECAAGFFEKELEATDAPNNTKAEAVDGPAHYGGKDNPYEVIKVAEAWGFNENAYLFNALKYLGRAGKKGSKVEDLKKLVFYAEREIALEEAK